MQGLELYDEQFLKDRINEDFADKYNTIEFL